MVACYFITNIKDDDGDQFLASWFKNVPIHRTVQLPDRLYKYTAFSNVEDRYIVHIGEPATELKKIKTYGELDVCAGIKILTDYNMWFIEIRDDKYSLEHVVDIFDQLIEWGKSGGTLFIFV